MIILAAVKETLMKTQQGSGFKNYFVHNPNKYFVNVV